MKRLLIISLIALTAAAQQPQRKRVMIGGGDMEERTKDWPRAEAGLAGFERFFDAMVARDLFSGTLLITKGDEVVLQKTVGYADKEKRIANTPGTKFNIGSINKIFTKVALLQLRREGKIDFAKTLRTYLPDYPSDLAGKVTIQQLLDHSSGMGDIFGPEYEATPKERLRDIASYVPLFAKKPLERVTSFWGW
jgi:CubicO group peptidase (beta-lactamase class C family)